MNAKFKKIILILLPVLAILFLSYGNFLKFHLASDAYRIIDNTNQFMINLKLIEGRLIQVLYFVILSIFGISINSINSYMFLYRINTIASIILLVVCTIFIYKILKKYIKDITTSKKIFLIICCLLLTVNVSICEYMLYFENVIIIFGLLLSIFSVYIYTKNIKFKHAIIIILLIISSFCYQGVNQIFITLSFLIFILKDKNNTNSKCYFKELFKIGMLYLIPLLVNYVISYILNNILPNLDPRLFTGILNNIKLNISPRNISLLGISFAIPACMILANFKLLDNRNISKHVFNIFLLVIISLLSFIIFIFNNSCNLPPRVMYNFYIIYPLLGIYIINLKNNKKYFVDIIVGSLMLIINIILVITLQNINIDYTNKNIQIVESFIYEIENYEKEHNTKINNIAFYTDSKFNSIYWMWNIPICSTYTSPIYYGYWANIYSINVLSERNFTKITEDKENKEIYNYFNSINWDGPNAHEQIKFTGDTANICTF